MNEKHGNKPEFNHYCLAEESVQRAVSKFFFFFKKNHPELDQEGDSVFPGTNPSERAAAAATAVTGLNFSESE